MVHVCSLTFILIGFILPLLSIEYFILQCYQGYKTRLKLISKVLSLDYLHIKNITRTTVPLPTSEWISTLCPNCFVISYTRYSPIPVDSLKSLPFSPVKKGLNTLGKSCFGIPTPLSAISSITVLPS